MISLLRNKHVLTKLTVAGMGLITLAAPLTFASYQVKASTAYDLSEYQGYLTPSKVKALKKEVSFVIIRAQDGGLRGDATFSHNVKLLQHYNVPYGVYSYSLYANAPQARAEADALHRRAPNAKFYANDMETNNAGGDLNYATSQWSKEMHRISDRPTVLYSGEYFMNSELSQHTRNQYNALWIAAYGAEPDPNYHYDLWQFSSSYYSRALGQALDADTLPDGNNKPLSFWIGNGTKHGPSENGRSNVKPLNSDTAKATIASQKAAIAKLQAEDASNKAKIKALKKRVAKFKAQANSAAKDANDQAQEINQLKNENTLQSRAMQKDTKKLNSDNDLISTLKSKISKLVKQINNLKDKLHPSSSKPGEPKKKSSQPKVESKYYTSNKIHHVKVTSKGGINIYDRNDDLKVGHAKKGEIIHVLHFKTEKDGSHMITRAVGDYGWTKYGNPRKVTFTSNKNFVRAYNYK